MRREVCALLVAATVVRGRAVARAEDAPAGIAGYTGGASLSAGYRTVDIDGSKAKYREDVNLRSGGRLFALDFEATAQAPDAEPVDRFHLQVDTPGDEPLSTFRLTAADTARWDLRADFTRSKYFYAVPQLFESPVAGDQRLDDLHDFDLIRTDGAVDFTLRLPSLPKVTLGYRLYRREGDTTSTVFVPEGDTFLVRAPIDARTHVGSIASEFRALGTDVSLQQEYRRVIRDLGEHGPLDPAGPGVDPTDGSTLVDYQGFRQEHVDAPATTVRLRREIGRRGEVTGAYFYSHASLSADADSRRDATADVPGLPERVRTFGMADGSLDTHVADVAGSWFVSDDVQLHASYRFDEQHQDASLDEVGTLGPLRVDTGYQVRTHRVTGDLEVLPLTTLTLRAGMRWAHRDANFSTGVGAIGTDTVGVVADARWRPVRPLEVFARYETAQVDDPYLVPGDPLVNPALRAREIAFTFTNRGSAGLKWRPRDWLQLSYRFLADSRENSSFDGRAMAFDNTASVTLTPLRDLSVFAAYTRRDVDDRADIDFAPLYTPTTSVQSGTEDVVVSQLSWDFGLWQQRWSTGWTVAYVHSDQSLRPRFEPGLAGRTVFDLDRIDAGAFLTLHHAFVEPSIEFRRIDYTERSLPANDYDATMLIFRLTRRFRF